MAVFNEPTKWAQTLGKDADVTAIPDTAGETDPSIDKIFPSVFSIPLANGGRAIPRSVLNGLFKLVGDCIFYMQNGGLWSYNSAFDYAVGRVVLYTDGNLYKCIQANGPSSIVVEPTHGTHWIKILEGLDLRNYANVDLSNLSVTGQAKIEGFADKDLNNITQVGKNTAISWLMPDLTSRIQVYAPYTAPSDGWLYIYLASEANGGELLINGVHVFLHDIYQNTNIASTGFVPVSKGDVITTIVNQSSFSLYFMPCKGA